MILKCLRKKDFGPDDVLSGSRNNSMIKYHNRSYLYRRQTVTGKAVVVPCISTKGLMFMSGIL